MTYIARTGGGRRRKDGKPDMRFKLARWYAAWNAIGYPISDNWIIEDMIAIRRANGLALINSRQELNVGNQGRVKLA